MSPGRAMPIQQPVCLEGPEVEEYIGEGRVVVRTPQLIEDASQGEPRQLEMPLLAEGSVQPGEYMGGEGRAIALPVARLEGIAQLARPRVDIRRQAVGVPSHRIVELRGVDRRCALIIGRIVHRIIILQDDASRGNWYRGRHGNEDDQRYSLFIAPQLAFSVDVL